MKARDAWRTFGKMWGVLQSVIHEAQRGLQEIGLGTKEFFVLSAIARVQTPSAISEETSMPSATVTDVIKRMEAAGYVERALDRVDLRRHQLTLTAKGKKVVEQGERLMCAAFGHRLAPLSTGEQASLIDLFSRL